MTKVYEQHDKAFQNVSAYVVLDKNGEHVASVKFKFPRDGAGRLYAYVHWIGLQMVRGSASGYGYDKRSAAVADAVGRFADMDKHPYCFKFFDAVARDGGEYWDRRLRDAGFTVIQAV